MKTKVLLLAAAGLLLAADRADDQAKKDLDGIQGTWSTVSLKYNGMDFTDKLKLKFVFKGNQATVEGSDEVKKEYARFTVKLDPSTTPRCVDVTVTAGVQKDVVIEGIYQLKDDEFKICAKVLGKDRPQEFAAPEGSSIVLLVIKKDKP